MTFLEKIKPHLISNDFLIQETVLNALHDFPNVPEEWTVELLKEAFNNKEKQTSILIFVENQTINEESIKILIGNIPKMDQSKVHLALNLVARIDPKLALKNREPLKKFIREEMWPLYELVVNGTEEEVYTEYGETLNDLERAASYQQDLYIKAKKLAACIVHNGWITEEEIDLVLKEELKEQWFSFNGILTIYMIGLLRLEKYIPLLTSLLIRDDDILLEEVATALIGFQSDEVVKQAVPYLRQSESIIFAASIVENIKSDLAIQVLREAYHEAEKLDDQDILIEALCHQLSIKAVPEISDHMKKEYSSGLVDIEQTVYGYYSILGQQHPDIELWKQAVMESELHFRNASNQKNLQQSVTVRKENKVGRNDPCPCGSGKKYKKCCG
ncbi:SEC-C metal-binding domain-containing protein [Neobacillus cucumis]|uniref:SEC-C metal-binding domain-containing protein n=1 Tax=Neobacillus cucumis TaxID=1740721 RepID=UPI001964BA7B|nr:SEC-C metal-binding domain-containing protein [Neobacillus cucumis]